MKVVLTGATGFIASHVLADLDTHSHEVTALVRDDIHEARARLGDYFAEVLLLDQGTDAARARAELGWYPAHPSLSDEFRHGSYRK